MTGRILALILCVSVLPAADEWPILTPKPGPSPRLNGPKVYGARPAKPFLYRIPCTGQRPITFSAKGLPKGITLDPQSGILRGTTPESKGTHVVSVEARNAHGRARREWKLIIGDTLSLTPQMGWNSWYTHYARVTDKVMREAADIMISSGLADAGYEFVSIDDCWARRADSSNPLHRGEPRDAAGNILTNADFPDMAGLTAYIHSKGLKTGIYTSPGPLTCGRYTGSWQHEEQDARTFAEWGFDLLKYDLCSYRRTPGANTLEEHKAPYAKMGAILQRMPRDIVLNLCQYGLMEVWKWGGEVGGQSWRTTGDLGLEKDTELPGFYSIAFKNAPKWEYAGPGRWNDPDYILIGVVGDAHQWQSGKDPERVKLTASEQYSYMSLWSLMASPLFYSGDMARLDDFTVNVLTNHEVIDVNQDVLGKQARIVRKTAEELVLAKPLEDGSLAVGLFNLTKSDRAITATWTDLALQGKRRMRDVWRQKDAGRADGELRQTVGAHGVAMIRLMK